ncbi:MAG: hypothetical protein JWP44_5059, partial [Mucilaginibacter sp.]|nr:hypothetical protein [Mucilaginibacter sp.]
VAQLEQRQEGMRSTGATTGQLPEPIPAPRFHEGDELDSAAG